MSSAAGEALGFDPELLSDVNTAVTEACNNVILHAYGDLPGPMCVELCAGADLIEVRVRDRGCGIRQTVPDNDGLKVGIALMSAVANRAEFINHPSGGTEVRLWFQSPAARLDGAALVEGCQMNGSAGWQAEVGSAVTGDVVLTVSPVGLLTPVLGRIGRALAPSAGFSLQGCSDVYRLSDALGAHAEAAADSSSISVALDAYERRLEFALAPLRAGSSARLEQAPGSPARAGAFADVPGEVAFSAGDGHETLRVSMRDPLRA
jgi:hypothetical protein